MDEYAIIIYKSTIITGYFMKDHEKELSCVIAPFMRQFGWTVCIHDYSGKITGSSDFKHRYHSFATCAYVKKRGFLQECISFDSELIQTRLFQSSSPFFKICHAGIIECVVPIKKSGIIMGTMFIGQFRWNSKLPLSDFIDPLQPRKSYPGTLPRKLYEKLIPLSPENLNDVIEISRTIAFRLESIIQSSEEDYGASDIKWRIEGFFSENFLKEPTLNSLARHIWLSESRTSHILKKHFGKTFPELINHYKLGRAKELLEYTNLSIREIACQSGFNDPGYFHRVFKKSENMTASQYRYFSEHKRSP